MSHRHKVKIEKLFEHPVSGNIDGRKVLSALEHYGARVEMTKHNKAKIFIKDKELIMALAHSSILTKDTILKLRHFLEEVGLVPDSIK
ncbi:hypothetical protein [Candidatus Sulfurimonas baltica]|uniref:Type II toxin-antitoxin system HicA family toxin n=1 Tax=Candidatus Sulfurimonas baltica TaxID=2740404 RepID=A0A7S7RM43_9BACT|nr:hypothetical protein [Candidatus Sulfurimonas baltica]QOY51058.1 hypothetical protein HUE88_07865 [Candidatus Sulfurimonas baltica]